MPTPKKGPRLGSNPKHQSLMLSNLASSLFEHERITTTEAKAKMLRPFAERLITKAKKGSVHHRRQVLSVIEDRDVVHKLFSDIGPRFADRNGGYTRILKIGPRNGDAAPMALIELVDEGVAMTVDETTDEASQGGRRRRLRAPRRQRGGEDMPQDKPTRSKAAQAAAEGSGEGADVEPPEVVVEEQAEAEAGADEAAAADSAAASDARTQADTGEVDQAETGGGSEQPQGDR